MKKEWWKEAVIYQIYPRSFYDSNGDGIGDLKGIIQKLDYLETLGINVLWISPCFQSPNADNGYDISDYRSIMKEFGSIDDFKMLLAEAKKRKIRILIDLVLNHTSDEHPWFQESRKSKENPFRDYYIWREPKKGREPNNWGSFFSDSAWEYDALTGEYYLHLFTKKQPDLNWENPRLREEIYEVIRYWLEMGVDGFRLDAINYIKKPESLPDVIGVTPGAEGYCADAELYANNEGFVDFLREMNERTLSGHDVMTVGECAVLTPQRALDYVGDRNALLNMVFNVELMFKKEYFTWADFKQTQREFIKVLQGQGWNSQFIQNHDIARSVSVLGNDKNYRQESAKMLATLVHTLPGTPYIYQGEEIGMSNAEFNSIEEFNDVLARFDYEEKIKCGNSKEEALKYVNKYSRDQARTPMQWNDEKYAGFSNHSPWLKVNGNYQTVNVANEIKKEDGIFAYYQKLIQLRKLHQVMIYGDFKEYCSERDDVYLFSRSYQESTWLIIINLCENHTKVQCPVILDEKYGKGQLVISNYPVKELKEFIELKPFEAMVWNISKN